MELIIKNLLDYILGSEKCYEIQYLKGKNLSIIEIKVDDAVMHKIIGRSGKTISAIKSIIYVLNNQEIEVKITSRKKEEIKKPLIFLRK